MRQHKFHVGSFQVVLPAPTALAVYAITKLTTSAGPCKVAAIKYLRSVTNAGLYEAKQIMDFISDNGRINGSGEFYIELPRAAVTYNEIED